MAVFAIQAPKRRRSVDLGQSYRGIVLKMDEDKPSRGETQSLDLAGEPARKVTDPFISHWFPNISAHSITVFEGLQVFISKPT